METIEYSSLEQAWTAAAGTAPLPPDLLAPAPRWFVAATETREEGRAAPSWLDRIVKLRSLSTLRTAVLSPEPCGVPELAGAPGKLPPGAALVVLAKGESSMRSGTRLAFDYHWVREVAAGEFRGDVGLAVDGIADAALETTVTGEFLIVLARDSSGKVRLRITRNRPGAASLGAGIKVGAQLQAPLPDAPGDLLRTIMGAHDANWFAALCGSYGEWLSERIRLPLGKLRETASAWRSLEPGFASALWQAFDNADSMRSVREWIPRIASMADSGQFREALAVVEAAVALGPARSAVVPFRGSAAERCVSAVTGSVLSALTNEEQWQKLRAAARQAAPLCADETLARTLRRLRVYATYEFAEKRLSRAARHPNAVFDPWLRDCLLNAVNGRRADDAYHRITGFVQKVYGAARLALQTRIAAELGWLVERTWCSEALVDAAFENPEQALEPYAFALAGDLTGILRHAPRLREAVLTHGIGAHTRLELRLPMLGRLEWSDAWHALAAATIETGENGRITAYTVQAVDRIEKARTHQSALALTGALSSHDPARFRAVYTDSRRFRHDQARLQLKPLIEAYRFPEAALDWVDAAPPGEIEAAFTLEAPEDATLAWLRAPRDRDPLFFPVWSAVSVAVQLALRRWLPYAWFSDLSNYATLNAAWPLMLYGCTRPFKCKPPAEFTYDIMEAGDLKIARQTTARALGAEMSRAGELLLAAGKHRVAKWYIETRPQVVIDTVERRPLNFNGLIQADTTFVHALVDLGRKGWEISALRENDPETALRLLAGFASDFTRQFHRRLRRLYGGRSFTAFGTLLLVEAARALGAAVGTSPAPAGTLRLTAGDQTRVFHAELAVPGVPVLAA